MKKRFIRSAYNRGDRLDFFLLSITTLLVTLLLFSNVSIPALSNVDDAKNGITFFNLNYFGYFTEVPLEIFYSAPIGAVAIFLIIILMIRRKVRCFISGKKKFLFFLIGLLALGAFIVNVLVFIPNSNSASTKMYLLGQPSSEAQSYSIGLSRFNMLYRISYFISLAAFIFYFYFIVTYLRSFNYCAESFVKFMLYIALLTSIAIFVGIFFNSSTQETIIHNFLAFMNRSYSVTEIYHPIISNSLLNSMLFAGCLSSLVLFYRKPNFFWYIIAVGFGLASFLTGNVYGFLLNVFIIFIVPIALLFNMRKHYVSTIGSLLVSVLIIAFIALSITVLKNMFPAVAQIFDQYVVRAKNAFVSDIYKWKVTLSTILFYSYGVFGFSPTVTPSVLFEVTKLYSVNGSPIATSGNAYIQMALEFGFIGVGLMVLAYAFIISRCFGMLMRKKKQGLFYLLVFISILLGGVVFDYSLFNFSPVSMLFVLAFIFPLSSDYHKGIIEAGQNLEPGEIKKVEHKYVNYDVQADDITQNKKYDQGVNSFQDAEYQENNRQNNVPPLNLPKKEDLEDKKKNRGRNRRLVEEEQDSQKENNNYNEEVYTSQENNNEVVEEKAQPVFHNEEIKETKPVYREKQYREPANIVREEREYREVKPIRQKEPEMIILKELPTTTIGQEEVVKEEKKTTPVAPEKKTTRRDDEYENIVEKQIEFRNEPIKAHYKKEARKINLVMTTPRINQPTGRIVQRVHVEKKTTDSDSYEIIAGKTQTIKAGEIVKERPRVIMDYDKFNHLKKEKLLTSSHNDTSNRNIRVIVDLNKGKPKEENLKISDDIDRILHSSLPPKKPKIEGVSFFDDLLAVGSNNSVRVDDFKKLSEKEKEELEMKKKLKGDNPSSEVFASQKYGNSQAVSFDDMLSEDTVKTASSSIESLLERKEERGKRTPSKVRIIKEGESELSDEVKKMFDALL